MLTYMDENLHSHFCCGFFVKKKQSIWKKTPKDQNLTDIKQEDQWAFCDLARESI